MAKLRKKQRIMMLVFGGVALAISATLVGMSFSSAISFFVSPTKLLENETSGQYAEGQRLKLGGVVEAEETMMADGTIRFVITDYDQSIPVNFKGILPDLFQPGEMAIAEGQYRDGVFVADSVLAKHDEKYRPREVEEALRESGRLHEYENQDAIN